MEQKIQVPVDKTSLISGGGFVILVLMLFLYKKPSKAKCRCYSTKRDARKDPLKTTAVIKTKEGPYFAIS
jgi:hypothetical protein